MTDTQIMLLMSAIYLSKVYSNKLNWIMGLGFLIAATLKGMGSL
jgi:hypothetical protein